ncbi:MAG: hypothetical protein AB1449_07510 [Chloroflexota bacterium]
MGREVRGKIIPIYTSRGDWSALLVFPYLFNTMGEWIGWLTPDRQIYDVDGIYVGWLTDEARIVRKRTYDRNPPSRKPLEAPQRIYPPPTVPLPPMMAELPFELIDVFEEEPDRLHTIDTGELKEDID